MWQSLDTVFTFLFPNHRQPLLVTRGLSLALGHWPRSGQFNFEASQHFHHVFDVFTIIRRASTRCLTSLWLPRTAYTKMYKIITEKVEAMCADGAADEQLAMAAGFESIWLVIQGARVDIIWRGLRCVRQIDWYGSGHKLPKTQHEQQSPRQWWQAKFMSRSKPSSRTWDFECVIYATLCAGPVVDREWLIGWKCFTWCHFNQLTLNLMSILLFCSSHCHVVI